MESPRSPVGKKIEYRTLSIKEDKSKISSNKQQPKELEYDRTFFKSTETIWIRKIMLCEECLSTDVSADFRKKKSKRRAELSFFFLPLASPFN